MNSWIMFQIFKTTERDPAVHKTLHRNSYQAVRPSFDRWFILDLTWPECGFSRFYAWYAWVDGSYCQSFFRSKVRFEI